MAFKIIRNDITKMNTEAIVNTDYDHTIVGTGCESAVYKAAGYDEILAWPSSEGFLLQKSSEKDDFYFQKV